MLDDRSLLVTGGTGSFGQALVREVLKRHRPRRLVVFSRDEQKQYRMAQRFPKEVHPAMRYFIGDVRDANRLKRAMDGIDFVVHAAAMKHVPIAEYNPFECIRTNVAGAENVISAAIDSGVERVIALSTDKAANPINLYGATKLVSDKCFIAANHLAASSNARFSVVRYGNVIGSRGSVVEHFQKLLRAGVTELPITDKEMTRFWITLRQGVDFVLDRLANMCGGELFVPKIPAMRIIDLAREVASFHGVSTCTFREIGMRPGEKLHEVLLPFDEAQYTLEHGDYYTVQPAFSWWKRENLRDRGRRVGKNFQYRSNRAERLLSPAELREILKFEEESANDTFTLAA
jgi:UDP-N-acetylglucosamine 4,6-dehydratase